tara:strand:+ start:850 stop:1002 length:153 start_codon:yes stop_codon:yes gene_type:complete
VGKKRRISIPSARKERQKYTSDVYRDKYDTIRWDNKKTAPTKKIRNKQGD